MPLIKISSTTLAASRFNTAPCPAIRSAGLSFRAVSRIRARGCFRHSAPAASFPNVRDREEAVERLRGSATSDITRALPATALRAAH